MIWMVLLSCGDANKDVSEVEDTSNTEIESVVEYKYSIAILADPHISGDTEHSARLVQAIDWINAHAQERHIEMVPVLGDVGWGSGLMEAKELLDHLEVPYVPLIGDNEVQYGEEQNFATVFDPQYSHLATVYEDWNYNGQSVWNPEEQKNSVFYNFAYSHKGIRFIGLDWAARVSGSILSELGYLHDFSGGSWEFFTGEMAQIGQNPSNSTIFFSHIPMLIGNFTQANMTQMQSVTDSYADVIYANFAGHLHVNIDDVEHAGYEVYVTDAVWDDVITVRVIDVYQDAQGFLFEQELIEFDWNESQ